MTEMNDEFIEAAFAKIRGNFEQRGNDDGLEIIDSYEERWDRTESLAHAKSPGWKGNWMEAGVMP